MANFADDSIPDDYNCDFTHDRKVIKVYIRPENYAYGEVDWATYNDSKDRRHDQSLNDVLLDYGKNAHLHSLYAPVEYYRFAVFVGNNQIYNEKFTWHQLSTKARRLKRKRAIIKRDHMIEYVAKSIRKDAEESVKRMSKRIKREPLEKYDY